MNITFSKNAWEEYLFWQKTDKRILKKINALLKEISHTPFEGKGKPEALKYDLSGFWSRRIEGEHRLVYQYETATILVYSCRYHYQK